MERFIFGKKEQFFWLQELCNDYQRHYWEDVILPASYGNLHTQLSFCRYPDDSYIIEIPPSTRVMTRNINESLDRLLLEHQMRFQSLNEMINFFWFLKPLYENNGDSLPVKSNGSNSGNNLTNWEKLDQLIAEKGKKKNVTSKDIAERLKMKIFGQDEAIDTISDMVALALMRTPRKITTIFLAGPTGVGKSQTAELLPSILTEITGEEYGSIEIKGNEFNDETSTKSFFGAPPGYVGYGNPTKFESIRRNPRTIVAIDEIEKANPAVLQSLMEVFDTGKVNLADNSSPLDLSQTIFILTSNLPVDEEELKKASSSFEKDEYFRNILTNYCKRPEISARIQTFVYFLPISSETILKIIFKLLEEELQSLNLVLRYIDERIVSSFLNISQTKYGVRAMRIEIQETIERALAQQGWLAEYKANVSIMGTGLNDIHFEISGLNT